MINLRELWLYDNDLSGGIPVELGNLKNLQDLGLAGNQLSGSIPSEFGNLSSLKALDLSGNPLDGPLPLSLANLAIRYLWFTDTNLCEPADAAFQTWLSQGKDLGRTGTICDSTR